jgi:hypothetical protein
MLLRMLLGMLLGLLRLVRGLLRWPNRPRC